MTERKKFYVYRYLKIDNDNGEREIPLTECPECGNKLERKDSVRIRFDGDDPDEDKDDELTSSSLECGILQDTPDLRVARDQMVNLHCAKCMISIIDHEQVDEEQFRF